MLAYYFVKIFRICFVLFGVEILEGHSLRLRLKTTLLWLRLSLLRLKSSLLRLNVLFLGKNVKFVPFLL